jgi:hypothetical protein
MPSTVVMRVGPMPEPTAAPPGRRFDDVTNGIRAVVDVEQRALRALRASTDLAVFELRR